QASILPNGWHKTFYTLWLGCFITGLGYSMTMPFISLIMAELGHYNKLQLNLYSGLAFAMTFIAQAIISPYWGNLADRKGRKLMCMRAAGVMSLTIFITGLAQSALFIICMRFLQGLFSGYINNATADRKSTRLNSSHVSISYAVFCLKKKSQVYNAYH